MSQMQRSAVTDKQYLAQIQSNGKEDKQTFLPAALALTPFSTWIEWIQLIPNHFRAYVCTYCIYCILYVARQTSKGMYK